ncbi:F-box domain-containing protein [Truncatella angustata]|uniref:F-box domain-containing protein n=1 Tax=Truncatella angustata TaxID=152316 RepID=A0A9P9A3J7_9PEZI|nr:F-box domain-containing protein [Truncatella angustata]KAH6660228.1 F-box domain-containing protein [Truncatella angustata]
MSTSQRVVTMDPPHITEFASQRYFDKLKQLTETKDQALPQDGSVISQSSTFILPIGRTKDQLINDALEKKKRANFSLRSILPSRASVDHERRISTEAGVKKSASFDQLFLVLPNELKIQIIASLPLSDILNLRLASRSWHAMVSFNELPITRYHIEHHIPAYALRLYPVPEFSKVNFHYLCGIWHRLHVAAKLAFLICEWITKEIFLRNTPAQRNDFAQQHERMRRRLIPLLFTVFHFFETYRDLHVKFVQEHGYGLNKAPYTINPVEAQIMSMYDDKTLLQVHQIFPMVVASFVRRLRPPSYAGRLERTLRGYLKDKPADEIYATALCVGGLRQVEKFWEIKGYSARRGAVDRWYNGLMKESKESFVEPRPHVPCVDAPTKPRRGFMGLHRKKSTFGTTDISIGHNEPTSPLPSVSNAPGRRGSETGRRLSDVSGIGRPSDSWIFDTSLAAGMPMGPLPKEQSRLVTPDVPILQQIWLPTAEALIMDRKVVERPQDIRRNAQVMLELIREDSAAMEDEWWYGTGAPESIRPPMEAIEEDPIE